MQKHVNFFVQGGELNKTIDKFLDHQDSVRKQIVEFGERYGEFTGSFTCDRAGHVTGLHYDKQPLDWVRVDYGYYRPHGRKKSVAQARDEMEALPLYPANGAFAKAIGTKNPVYNGRSILSVGMETFGKHRVLNIPVDDEGNVDKPDGCVELSHSSYIQLKRRAE